MDKINKLRKFRRIALSVLLSMLAAFSTMLNNHFNGEIYAYKSVDRAFGTEALERSQGVTTDGFSWIYSGKTSLIKIAFDNETVLAINKKAIPEELAKNFGAAHIGGISYADGMVYAAIEDSKVWKNPIVALFDGETLEYTGTYFALPGKDSGSDHALTRGVPWVACNTVEGVFYVGECKNTTALDAYDLTTGEYVASVALDTPVDKIQGGEMYKDCLYVATNDATRAVYRISVKTGEVEKYFDRIMYKAKLIDNFGGEGEDMTVLPMPDGTLFHALNIGATFLDANLRHYVPKNPEEIPGDRPMVTYLDKFLLEPMAGDSYTLITEKQSGEDTPLPITFYKNGNKNAVAMKLSEMLAIDLKLPGLSKLTEIKLIDDGENFIVCFPTGYTILEGEEIDEFRRLLEQSGSQVALDKDKLQYRGITSQDAQIVESYTVLEENVIYNFYFTSAGITRWEIVDMDTGNILDTMVMNIKTGVTDKDAFTCSGKQYTMEELEKMFGVLS